MSATDLDAIVARLERATHAIETLTAQAAQVTPALAVVADSADEFVARADARGVHVDARVHDAVAMLERLTAPETMHRLNALLDRLPQLEQLLTLADQAPGFVAMGADSLDDVMRDLQRRGVDVEAGLLNGASAALRFGAHIGPAQVDAIESVLTSGVLDPNVVSLIGRMGSSLATAAETAPEPVGLGGALRALRDPHVKQALGLLLTFAAEFGRHLETGTRGRVRA
jgi:hypothetical protein